MPSAVKGSLYPGSCPGDGPKLHRHCLIRHPSGSNGYLKNGEFRTCSSHLSCLLLIHSPSVSKILSNIFELSISIDCTFFQISSGLCNLHFSLLWSRVGSCKSEITTAREWHFAWKQFSTKVYKLKN